LNNLDDFTLGLITNREVIEVNQDSLGRPAQMLYPDNSVMIKVLSDKSVALGLLNWDPGNKWVGVKFSDIQNATGIDFSGYSRVRDLWHRREYSLSEKEFVYWVNGTSAQMFRLFPLDYPP
jgi:alpha-galactosidase